MPKGNSISACVVVFNEESVIDRCLSSIKALVDEIIVVHDGPCKDKTLEIARRYTDKVFERPHVGMMEAHLVFAFREAKSEWLFRIDADEYLDENDHKAIREAVQKNDVNAYIFKWEMWNGKKTVYFPGLQKMCLVRASAFHYLGIPHENGRVDGLAQKIDLVLHHRPAYNNVSWSSFMRKTRKWIPVHARYYFPERISFETYNDSPQKWIETANRTREKIWYYLVFDPVKMSLGQFKNGLWKSFRGWQVAAERYVYFFMLYSRVLRLMKDKH